MFQDLRTILRTKSLLVILAISALVRLFFYFIYLPSTPSSFGPDEGTYAALSKYVALGLPVEEFPAYGAGLYNSARSLILPSAGLFKLGLNELDSVRFISSIYGLLSSIFLALIFLNCYRLLSTSRRLNLNVFQSRTVFLFGVFTFFPSNFVWSTIGLRESASQFWLIATLYFLIKFVHSRGAQRWAYGTSSVFSLTLAHGARPETALIFSLIALIFGLYMMITSREFSLGIVVFLGLALGQVFTTTPTVASSIELTAFPLVNQPPEKTLTPTPVETRQSATPTPVETRQSATPTPVETRQSATPTPVETRQSATPTPVETRQSATPTPVETRQSATPTPVETRQSATPDKNLSALCKESNQVIRDESGTYMCSEIKKYSAINRNPVEKFQQEILTVQILEYKRNVNAVDAQSALPVKTCDNGSRDPLALLECNLKELPYRLSAFLFRPFPILDQGSKVMNYASFENLIWLLLISFTLFSAIWKNKNQFEKQFSVILMSYVLVFSAAAALYEGNLGSAFRHKSSILWPLILVLMISPFPDSQFTRLKFAKKY